MSLLWILVLGSAGMLIMCFGIVTFVFMYQKKHLANRLELSWMETKHKEELLQSTIEKVENERKRIARDLHDEIGLQFTLLSQKIEEYKSNPEKHSKEQLFKEIRSLADTGLKSTRRIAYEIMPPEIGTIGVIAALENFCLQLNKSSSIAVNFNTDKVELEPTANVSIALFRITQELISNTIKYAGASRIDIDIRIENSTLKYTYKDDGTGFNIAIANEKGGIGLRSVANRVKMINGHLEFKNNLNQGILVLIEVPHFNYETNN